MAKRHDIHRPSAIVPDDYVFVGMQNDKVDDIVGGALVLQEERQAIRRHFEMTGGQYATHEHGGACHVCGAHCIYIAVFYHEDSNTYIRTGTDCAEKLHMGDERRFRVYRDACRDALAAKAGRAKAEQILIDAGLQRCWELYNAEPDERFDAGMLDETRDGGFYLNSHGEALVDIVGKLVRFGSISDKQEMFLHKLLELLANSFRIKAERAAEKEAAEPVPEGREALRGIVLKTDYRETNFGEQLKLLFKEERGFVLWGTCPAALHLVEDAEGRQRGLKHGDRVEFTATLKPDVRDEKFGYYSRPTKPRFVAEAK